MSVVAATVYHHDSGYGLSSHPPRKLQPCRVHDSWMPTTNLPFVRADPYLGSFPIKALIARFGSLKKQIAPFKRFIKIITKNPQAFNNSSLGSANRGKSFHSLAAAQSTHHPQLTDVPFRQLGDWLPTRS